MLQVMKLICNHELLGYSHSNGSMKSARRQLFSLFRDLQQKRLKKNEKIFCIFQKPRCNN